MAELAKKEGAQVLVIECMAVDPRLQYAAQHQILQADIGVVDGQEFHTASVIFDTEGAVQTEHTDTVSTIEIRNDIEEFIFVCRVCKLFAECLHLFADAAIVAFFRLGNRFIAREDGEAIDAESIFDLGKIELEKLAEYAEIVFGEMVDGAFARASAFGGQRKRIFICDEQKCEIILPEVFIEAVGGGEIKNTLDLRIDTADERRFVGCARTEILEDIRKRKEDRIFAEVAEQQ